MFKGLFGKSSSDDSATISRSPGKEALLNTIREKSKTDPLIGPKIISKEVVERVIEALKSPKGVHAESLIASLASVAGYSCQASIRELAILNKLEPNAAFIVVNGKDGKRYFFGEHLNKPLAEDKFSIWSIAGFGAQEAGCKALPDLKEIFEFVSGTVGGEGFGKPRIPDGHQPSHLPIEYVKLFWTALDSLVKEFCPNPSLWPITYGLALQQVLVMCKDALRPELAFSICMECAVPMSKVDLDAY